jgi:hypothetical protein
MSVVRIRERLPGFPVAKHERDRLQNDYERGKHPSGNPLHDSDVLSTSHARARGPTGWSTDFYSVPCRFESCRARQKTTRTSFNAGLGHRLITWLPSRPSRFESGSPRHSTLRLSARISVFHTEEASSILAGCAIRVGSFSGMPARFERAYERFDSFPHYQSLGLSGGFAAHNGEQDGSKPLRATVSFRPRLSARTLACGAGRHGAAPWVGTNLGSKAQADERWPPKPEVPGSRPGSPAIFSSAVRNDCRARHGDTVRLNVDQGRSVTSEQCGLDLAPPSPAGLFHQGLSTAANRSENVAALASRAAASEDEIKV